MCVVLWGNKHHHRSDLFKAIADARFWGPRLGTRAWGRALGDHARRPALGDPRLVTALGDRARGPALGTALGDRPTALGAHGQMSMV